MLAARHDDNDDDDDDDVIFAEYILKLHSDKIPYDFLEDNFSSEAIAEIFTGLVKSLINRIRFY